MDTPRASLDNTKKKVLVVDDERGTVLILTKHFEGMGFEVVSAFDGLAALAAVRQTRPDLIVLDRMMPKMDGLKVCAMLKSDKRFKDIPIIMATASADRATQQLSEELGANVFVNKPLNMAEISSAVRKLLGLEEPPPVSG
ncbi:MAG: response regulator [Elusimicrobia bacterium]|nr:response regulator [Elusimicrobiota bacterium]